MPFDESLLEPVEQAPVTEGFDESLLVEETPQPSVSRLRHLLDQAVTGAAVQANLGDLSLSGDFPSGQAPSPREMVRQAFEPTIPIPGPLAWTKPIEPLLPAQIAEPLAGIREGTSSVLTGMTSPAMLATLGVGGLVSAGVRSTAPTVRAVSMIAGRLMAAGFTADMIRNMGPAAAQLGTAVASGDSKAIARAATEAAANAVMAIGAGKAGTEGAANWTLEKARNVVEDAAFAHVRDQAAADIANESSLPGTGAAREIVSEPHSVTQEVLDALRKPETAPVHEDVRAQPVLGQEPVPAAEGAERVLGREPAQGEAGAGEVPVEPKPATMSDVPPGDLSIAGGYPVTIERPDGTRYQAWRRFKDWELPSGNIPTIARATWNADKPGIAGLSDGLLRKGEKIVLEEKDKAVQPKGSASAAPEGAESVGPGEVAKPTPEAPAVPAKPAEPTTPIITEAVRRMDTIYLSFDMAGKVPTAAELTQQFKALGHDVDFIQFEPNVISTGSGIVKFRGDAHRPEGPMSEAMAKEAFKKAFGQDTDIRERSAIEKRLPFEQRFSASLRAYSDKEAGVSRPKPVVEPKPLTASEKADAKAELEETVPAAKSEEPAEPAPEAPKLPGITIKPKSPGEAGAVALPPVPPVLEAALRRLNRDRKAFSTLFNARGNRRFMDQTIDAADGSARIAGQREFKGLELRGSKADREAAVAIIEANGDPRKLNQFATQSANDRRALAAVRLAQADWTRLQPLVRHMEQILDRQILEEQAAGIDTAYRDAYVPHLLDTDLLMGRGRPFIIAGSRGSGLTTAFMKGRAYDTIFDAIQDGYRPRSIDAADLAEHRVRVGQRLINRTHWSDGLRNVFDPTDGKPIVAELQQHTRKTGSSYSSAPLGYTARELIPGVRIAVHEGYARLFDALTGTSGISSSIPGQIALGTVGGIKHGLLLFDTFHASRIMQKEFFLTGRVSYKKGYSLLEYSDKDLALAVKQKVITPEIESWVQANRATGELLVKSGLNVGRIAENIAPGFIRKLPGIGHFNRWVFDKVTRGAMMQAGLLEFERVSKARPDMAPKDVAMQVARDLNVYFGNLGRQGFFKSGTALDLSRIAALAPQWVESMARTEARGYGQIVKGLTTDPILHRTLMTGTLARGVGQGLLAYFVGTQLLNLWTRKQPTWKNEETGHKLDAWIPDWSGKGAGFFLSPFSVVAELSHDMIRYSETEPTKLDAALRIASNKSGPLVRAARILATGKTFGGEKIIDSWDRIKAAAVSLAPLPIPAQSSIKGTDYPGQTQRQLSASLGFKIEPAPTKQGEVRNLATAWLSKQTDPKLKHEFEQRQQQEFGISDYKKLRNALYSGDLARARTEYDRLRKEDGKAAKDISSVMNPRTTDGAMKPIITPHATEQKFLASLTPAQKAQYRQAQQERVELYRSFRKMLAAP